MALLITLEQPGSNVAEAARNVNRRAFLSDRKSRGDTKRLKLVLFEISTHHRQTFEQESLDTEKALDDEATKNTLDFRDTGTGSVGSERLDKDSS